MAPMTRKPIIDITRSNASSKKGSDIAIAMMSLADLSESCIRRKVMSIETIWQKGQSSSSPNHGWNWLWEIDYEKVRLPYIMAMMWIMPSWCTRRYSAITKVKRPMTGGIILSNDVSMTYDSPCYPIKVRQLRRIYVTIYIVEQGATRHQKERLRQNLLYVVATERNVRKGIHVTIKTNDKPEFKEVHETILWQ